MSKPQRIRRRAGFTLVEVMLAVSLLVVGAAGFTLLQGASGLAVQAAHETAAAVAFQETWVARLQRDTLAWTSLGTGTLGQTKYLGNARDAWFVPAPELDPESWAADGYGRDTRDAKAMRYCVNLRLVSSHLWNPMTFPASEDDINMLRADVRVWWHRSGSSGDVTDRSIANMATNSCKAIPTAAELAGGKLRQSVTYTMLRWRP